MLKNETMLINSYEKLTIKKEFVKIPFNQEGLWLFLLRMSVQKNVILLVNIKRFCHENSRYLIRVYLP